MNLETGKSENLTKNTVTQSIGPDVGELIGINYSPFTEKARWALDHHHLRYTYREHLILFGMPELRWKTRKFLGDLTVPTLIGRPGISGKSSGDVYSDSWDIAVFADDVGTGTKLIPKEQFTKIQEINQLSERALDAGRALVMHRISNHKGAQLDSLPPFIPKIARPAFRFLVNVGMAYLDNGFKVSRKTPEAHEAEYRKLMNEFRTLLDGRMRSTILDQFSYADIVVASTLQFINPGKGAPVKWSPALLEGWTDNRLSGEFADLIGWRDWLYSSYRGRS